MSPMVEKVLYASCERGYKLYMMVTFKFMDKYYILFLI